MKRQEYSDQVKAAVLAALLTGATPGELEQQYRVPAATIRSWKSRQAGSEAVAIVATDKREEVGGLLVEFLRESIRTLSVQVQHFRDPAWLAQQSAAEAAHLFGAVTDRTFRLLEALEAGAEAAAEGSGGSGGSEG